MSTKNILLNIQETYQ